MATSVDIPEIGDNIKSFSVTEDATPIIPGETSGGVGQLDLTVDDFPEAIFLKRNDITFTDGDNGTFVGSNTNISENDDDSLSITVLSNLKNFNVSKTVQPFTGRFDEAFAYWCDICHITAPVTMDDSIAERQVLYPGWVGNVWEMIKHAFVVEELEIASDASGGIVIRELRERTISTDNVDSIRKSVSSDNVVEYVNVNYYNNVRTGYPTLGRGYVSNATSAMNPGSNSVDLRLMIDVPETLSIDKTIMSKGLAFGADFTFEVNITASRELQFRRSVNGSTISTVTSPVLTPGKQAVRVFYNPTPFFWTLEFYTGPTIGGPWTQILSIGAGVSNQWLYSSTNQARVGSNQAWSGFIYEAQFIYGGVLIASPNFTEQQLGTAPFNDAQGRTWAFTTTVPTDGVQFDVASALYPVKNEEPQIFQVESGERLEIELELDAYVISVFQPECVEWVNDDPDFYARTEGVYSVVGADGLPVAPALWNDYGGSLKVEKTDDPRIIKVVLSGAVYPTLAPFSIAMSAGTGNYYNSLHIVGESIRFEVKTVNFPTGANPKDVGEDSFVTIENPFITNVSQAINLGARAAAEYAGNNFSMSLTSTEAFEEGFGEIVGARVIDPSGVNWRVNNVNTNENFINVTATSDVTLGDFEARWAGLDEGDYESFWAGKTLRDEYLLPLRTS